MYYLRRIHIEGAGHSDARFDPLDLHFPAEPGAKPADTVVWLRNGGGKTSLLALFYSLLEPDRRHFLGGHNNQKKAIEHYVRGDDVAHVVAEWGRAFESEAQLPGFGGAERLVTGQVMAWRRTGAKQELERYYYAFRPQPNRLEMDTIPFRLDATHRRPFHDFLSILRRLRDEEPRLELMVTDNQRAWRQYLENAYLDPEVFRYQLVMNDDEGGAAEFLDFKDGDSFIAFLLKLVTDTNRVSQVDENIGRVARLFAERPTLELELEFTKGIAERGPALVDASQSCAVTRAELEMRRREAATLLARITASIRGNERSLTDLGDQQKALQAGISASERDRELWSGRALALEEMVARFRLDQAKSAVAEAMAEVSLRKREAEAWALTEERLRGRALQGQIDGLRLQLDANTVDQRRAYDSAAVRYRHRLERLLATATAQAGEAQRAVEEAEETVGAAEDQIRKTAERLAALKARQQGLQGQLDEATSVREQLTRVGAMAPDESPADALSRVADGLADASERLDRIDAELAQLDTERVELQAERSDSQLELARTNADLRAASEKRAALAKRLGALAHEPDVLETMGGSVVDVLAHAPTIRSELIDRAAEVNRVLVSLGVDTEEIRRALAFLKSSGFLPPSRDAERAIQLLVEHDIPASSGWQYLADNVRATEHRDFVERNPELVTGIVVHRGHLEEALIVLGPAFTPTQPLTIAENEAWEPSRKPESLPKWRVIASAGHYDPRSADEERARRDALIKDAEARRARLMGQLERIQRVQSELARLCEESPADGLAFFDEQIEAHERAVDVLDSQLEATALRFREIDSDQQRLKNERRSRERERDKLRDHKLRLELFQPRAAQMGEWLQTLEVLIHEIANAATSLRRIESDRDEGLRARSDALRQVGEAQSQCTTYRLLEQQIEIPSADVEVVDDPSVLLEVLKTAYLTARRAYEAQMSQSATAQLLRAKEEQLVSVNEVLGGKPPEVLLLMDTLLDRPDAATRLGRELATSRAQESADAAIKRLGHCEDEAKVAAQEVKDKAAAVTARRVDLPDALRPLSFEEAQARLAEARQQVETVQKRYTGLQGDLQEAHDRLKAISHSNEVLAQVAGRIGPRLDSRETSQTEDDGFAAEPISVEDAKREVETVEQGLSSAERTLKEGEEGLRTAAQAMRSFAQKSAFDILPSIIRKAYLAEDDDGLAATTAEQSSEIDKRVASLSDELRKLSSHRSGVVLELTDLVKEALRTFEEAQGVKLPNGLGEWSGQPYLRIAYDDPEPNQIAGRMQAFVDDLIRAKARVEGMAMLIEGVRAAVGRQPFRVTVLKPNEGLPRARAQVEEIKNWSGGQKLTTALVLYCVLVRLRLRSADRKNRSQSQAVVLLLDNPIGTANLIDLIDLQLKVAQELDIQMIITTGVNDYSAIAAYPNVIRLRNRRDLRTKAGYVMADTVADGQDGANGPMEGLVAAARVRRSVDLPTRDGRA